MIVKLSNIPFKTIAIFLIVVVGIFSINEYLYIHKHIFKNGSVVVHAHPFNKSTDTGQNKSHQHEAGDLVYFASLQMFIPTVVFVFIALVSSAKHIFTEKRLIINPSFVYLFNQERTPPHFLLRPSFARLG